MSTKIKKKDIKEVKNELEKILIKEVILNARNGIDHTGDPNSYMDAYVLATEYSLEGDEESESLFLYHNKIIKDFIEESYKIIRQETKEQLIDSFIKQTENINILIYWMNRIFTFLDCFYNF